MFRLLSRLYWLLAADRFLSALQRVSPGPLRLPSAPATRAAFHDLQPAEVASIAPLLAASVAIGAAPRFLPDVIGPATIALVAR